MASAQSLQLPYRTCTGTLISVPTGMIVGTCCHVWVWGQTPRSMSQDQLAGLFAMKNGVRLLQVTLCALYIGRYRCPEESRREPVKTALAL